MREQICLLLLSIATIGLGAPDTTKKCSSQFRKNGCFRQSKLLSTMLINDRDGSSGHLIKWNDYTNSLNSLACRCAEEAKKQGFKVIGIQYFGECYGSKKHLHEIATELIPSTSCIGGDYEKCVISDDANACSGTADSVSAYIVDIFKSGDDRIKINGNYSEWGPWSECSSTCGPGIQERNRICNNPPPSNGGADCEAIGPSEMQQACKNVECPKAKWPNKYCTRIREDAEFCFAEAGLHSSPKHPFCVVMSEGIANPKSYKISAQVFGYDSQMGEDANNFGLMFNAKDLDNYQFIYLHLKSEFFCYTYGRVKNGEDDWRKKKSDQCPGKAYYGQKWTALEVQVGNKTAGFYVNKEKLIDMPLLDPSTGRGGLIVKNGRTNSVLFNYLKVE